MKAGPPGESGSYWRPWEPTGLSPGWGTGGRASVLLPREGSPGTVLGARQAGVVSTASWSFLEPTAPMQLEDAPKQASLALQHPEHDGDKDMGSKSAGTGFQG